jgi:hypothetical protein
VARRQWLAGRFSSEAIDTRGEYFDAAVQRLHVFRGGHAELVNRRRTRAWKIFSRLAQAPPACSLTVSTRC